MTLREELVEVGARAWWGAMVDEHNTWENLGGDEQDELMVGSTAALDAILAKLKKPSEEMLWAYKEAVTKHAIANEGHRLTNDYVRNAWQAMLSTLDAKP